jgi:hypothetical protein
MKIKASSLHLFAQQQATNSSGGIFSTLLVSDWLPQSKEMTMA